MEKFKATLTLRAATKTHHPHTQPYTYLGVEITMTLN
jgi:hypothetical protein